jgi:hypothetical protein
MQARKLQFHVLNQCSIQDNFRTDTEVHRGCNEMEHQRVESTYVQDTFCNSPPKCVLRPLMTSYW